jgi:hypothetical protein
MDEFDSNQLKHSLSKSKVVADLPVELWMHVFEQLDLSNVHARSGN